MFYTGLASRIACLPGFRLWYDTGMTRFTLKEAKERLPELLREVASGGVVVVELDGQEIALAKTSPIIESASRAQEAEAATEQVSVPDYSEFFPDEEFVQAAHLYTWEYVNGEITLVKRPGRSRERIGGFLTS